MHSWLYVFVLHYAIVSLWYWHEVECNELIYSYLSLYADTPGHLFSSTALGCISLFLHCCTECQLWAISSKYIQCYVNLSFFLKQTLAKFLSMANMNYLHTAQHLGMMKSFWTLAIRRYHTCSKFPCDSNMEAEAFGVYPFKNLRIWWWQGLQLTCPLSL
jgi:hypothetical protein